MIITSKVNDDYCHLSVIEIEARHCLASDEGEEPIASEGRALISSYFVEMALRQGQSSCTLKLKAKPGQRWNISLVDFGVPRTHSASSTSGEDVLRDLESSEDSESLRLPVCRQYAAIRDERSAAKSVVCGGGTSRDKVVHLSTGHLIQVEVFSRARDSGISAQFLLRVEGE